MFFKNWFKGFLKPKKDLVYEYLSDAVSLADLERRQRLVERGEAPFQKRCAFQARM